MTVTITWSTLGTLAAALVCAVAVLPGTWHAAHGRFYVSPATWTIWAALGVVALASQIEMGGAPQIVLCTVLGFSAITMAVVAVWVRLTGRTPVRDAVAWQSSVDAVCFGGAAAAFLTMLLSTAEAAIALTILTDAIAAIPTLVAAWTAPREQPAAMFYGVAVSSGLTVLAGGTPGRLVEVAYPMYVFALGVVVSGVIVGRRWWLDRPRPAPVPTATAPAWWPEHLTPYEAFIRHTTATRERTAR